MSTLTQSTTTDRVFQAKNYCLGFIDLLGQRAEMQGQALIPGFATDAEREEFMRAMRSSVVAILSLQDDAEGMLAGLLEPRDAGGLAKQLPPPLQQQWAAMNRTAFKRQRWSDGLTFFASLAEPDGPCVMNGVFDVFTMCGTLYLLGLAQRRPIRGGIDIAWGKELQKDEIYGPAVARAYELESAVAQYPRIVVGDQAVDYLRAQAARTENDHFSSLNRELAEICSMMILKDSDGRPIIHYLGDTFREHVTQSHHGALCDAARAFIYDELSQHREARNTKLVLRYDQLLRYFEAFAPATEAAGINSADKVEPLADDGQAQE